MGWIQRSFISGLVLVLPLLMSFAAVAYLLLAIAELPLVANVEPMWVRPLIVFAVFGATVMAFGYLMRTALGVLIADWIRTFINHIPLLRVVYNASQLAVETAIDRDGGRVEPVKVETWEGLRLTAFKTGKRTVDGRVLCFMPTAPNITTGYVIEVDPVDVHPTGERIETALTRLLSAGFGDRQETAPSEPPTGRTVGTVRQGRVRIDPESLPSSLR